MRTQGEALGGCLARGGALGRSGGSPAKIGILVLQMAILLLDFDGRYSLDEHVMPLLSILYAKESF